MDTDSILIINGSPGGISPQRLARLAADATTVLAVDSGANWAHRAKLTPDVLVGDFDSIDPEIKESFCQDGVELVASPVDKDYSDLDLALGEVWRRYATLQTVRLVVCNTLGGRVDHELAALGSLLTYAKRHPLLPAPLIVEDNCRATLLVAADAAFIATDTPLASTRCRADGATVTSTAPRVSSRARTPDMIDLARLDVSNLAEVGQTLSLIPLLGPAQITVTGMKWELAAATIDGLSARGLSNIVTDADARAIVHRGCVLVVAPSKPTGDPHQTLHSPRPQSQGR
ncbi:MAG: thiamine diphosphokinase [Coriobacteriales bacterium]|nr:thiamine diphosphokinase [Coriobacteriales bacterium]